MFQFIRKAVKSVATKILKFAVTRNWLFLARVSVFCGANVNHATPVTGDTPLHICKSQKMCELLLRKGANIHSINSSNETALQKLTEKNINLLWCAMSNYDRKLMKFLIEKGADANYPATEGLIKGYPPIWWAVLHDEIEIVKLLLEHGADINYMVSEGYYKDTNLLLLARYEYKITIVKLLLEKGINTNFKERQQILCWAATFATNDSNEVAKILLEKGADVNHVLTEGYYKNLTPLWWAISYNNLDLAKFFIDNHRANINFINNQGRTMLMAETAKYRGTPIVEFLLKNGATVELQQPAWQTILDNPHSNNCKALINNASNVKPILTMLELQLKAKQKNLNASLNMLPLDGCFKPLKEMLTGHKVTTQAKAKLN